ncbi:hypothetical protein LARI1_G009084 [Lachnellula arida]|uniref:Heterokaryon incompatibility domain-containing protein n=1 Tax=Lachnellula arida TaxID=1316785 RepID=A0A8T9B435_9HELO|nr:hypothetical protein LARI1_G009084 [Lachnellula arida]
MDYITPAGIFCQVCCEIFSDGLTHTWEQPTHLFQRSRQTLIKAVEDRCWLCARLNQTRDNNESEAVDEILSGSYQFETLIDSCGGLRRLLRIDLLGTIKVFEISVQQGGAKVLDMAQRSLAKTWTGHEDVAMLAASWLSECRGKHATCNTASSSDWRPSRLIEISSDKIRLVLTATENVDKPYATLSHCWGSAEFFVLNSQNIRRFLEGIPMDQIPRTFQETVIMIRNLGIKYLWIDCYCIIQGIDSVAQADWARVRCFGNVLDWPPVKLFLWIRSSMTMAGPVTILSGLSSLMVQAITQI